MAKYIRLATALDLLETNLGFRDTTDCDLAKAILLEMPGIEVVRCGDCRLHNLCHVEDILRQSKVQECNRFCGYGKQKSK